MTKPRLKQFGDLKPEDFETHPVWVSCHIIDYDEPWYDDTDEETFRPFLGPLPVDAGLAMLLVAAEFVLCDGTRFRGFVTPMKGSGRSNTVDDLGTMQPNMFLSDGTRRDFWFGMFAPKAGEQARLYQQLRRGSEQVFPIRFEALPGLTVGVDRGEIPGFCWLDDDRVIRIVQ